VAIYRWGAMAQSNSSSDSTRRGKFKADLGRSRIPIVDGAREKGKFINISSSSNGDKTGLVDISCAMGRTSEVI